MKNGLMRRLLALIAALALALSAAALAEPPEGEEAALPALEEEPEGEVLSAPVDAPVEAMDELPLPAGEAEESGAELFERAAPDVSAPEATGPAAVDSPSAATAPDLRMGLGEVFALGRAGARYASDAPEVVSVDASTGVVTAKGLGRATILAADKSGNTAQRVVEVLAAPTSLGFEDDGLSLGKGEARQLRLRLPEGTAAARIKYSSSKKSVVKVSQTGELTAKKTGTATITAVAYNGVKAKLKVKVSKAPSKVKLSAGKLVLSVGESGTLTAALPKKSASRIAWTSSDPGVVSVDESGALTAVGPGAATVTAATFNKKKASCKVAVLEGRHPTRLSLGAQSVSMGLKEKLQLAPEVGEGESGLFAYSSSKKSVATVSSKGVVTAKKKGTAKITVKTHNGLKATLTVKVAKAPSKVKLSQKALKLAAGQSAQLTAKLPSGTASSLAWKSSDTSVATVDAEGRVAALKPGKATVAVRTFNKKVAKCTVTVTEAAAEEEAVEQPVVTASTPSTARMAANLRGNSALGAKRGAIASVVELLINAGFEPAFAAGVGANVYAEGNYGMFESSKYIKNYQKRPRYFCYLDGGDYYTKKNGEYVLTAVYLSKEEMADYTGRAEARERYGEENYYRDNFSGKYVQDIQLTDLEAFVEALAAGGWEGKFGVGVVQWTGSRTRKLVQLYRKHADEDGGLTAAQVAAAENEMILYDFKGDYAGVYSAWKKANGALNSAEAARSAGALVCTRYEIPVDKESKSVTRGSKAAEIYRIMTGN